MKDRTFNMLQGSITIALLALLLAPQCNAQRKCAPQQGSWSVWAGTVCYGEPKR